MHHDSTDWFHLWLSNQLHIPEEEGISCEVKEQWTESGDSPREVGLFDAHPKLMLTVARALLEPYWTISDDVTRNGLSEPIAGSWRIFIHGIILLGKHDDVRGECSFKWLVLGTWSRRIWRLTHLPSDISVCGVSAQCELFWLPSTPTCLAAPWSNVVCSIHHLRQHWYRRLLINLALVSL